jgi:hypothetical protein
MLGTRIELMISSQLPHPKIIREHGLPRACK